MPKADAKAKRSLSQYVRDKRREGCPVCALSPQLLTEIRAASKNKIPRDVVLEWLKIEHGVKVTHQEIVAHANARHDSGDE